MSSLSCVRGDAEVRFGTESVMVFDCASMCTAGVVDELGACGDDAKEAVLPLAATVGSAIDAAVPEGPPACVSDGSAVCEGESTIAHSMALRGWTVGDVVMVCGVVDMTMTRCSTR